MKRIKALVTADMDISALNEFDNAIEFIRDGYAIDYNVMPHKELANIIKNYEILICEYDTIDAEVLKNAENLKLIICCRGGIKSVVDVDLAEKMGIKVFNTMGRNANAVSDFTMAFILDMTRNVMKADRLIQSRQITTAVSTKPKEYKDTVWGLDSSTPFIKLRGKSINHMTLGIFGFGCAGKLVAKKANTFDMKILVCDPYINEKDAPDYVSFVSKEQLLKNSDVISLHCNVSADKSKLIAKAEFDMMKDGAYFINTARGELLDEAALIEALYSEKISGAALDVTAVEPIASDSPLLDAPNLILTPHIAGSSFDVQFQGALIVKKILEDYLKGEK